MKSNNKMAEMSVHSTPVHHSPKVLKRFLNHPWKYLNLAQKSPPKKPFMIVSGFKQRLSVTFIQFFVFTVHTHTCFNWCTSCFLPAENSSVLKSYMSGEVFPRDAESVTLPCFLVYRSVPRLRTTQTQLEGKTHKHTHACTRKQTHIHVLTLDWSCLPWHSTVLSAAEIHLLVLHASDQCLDKSYFNETVFILQMLFLLKRSGNFFF